MILVSKKAAWFCFRKMFSRTKTRKARSSTKGQAGSNFKGPSLVRPHPNPSPKEKDVL
ncbi:MAG: hypothetical protein ACTHK8_10210 [Ginsengibacter sp.]